MSEQLVNLIKKGGGSGTEKEIVHVDTLPVSPNIEDKVYEVGPVGDVMTITTPPNGTNFRDYFSQFPFFTIGINSDTGKYYADASQEYFVCMTNVGGAIWSGRADLITIEDASTSTATNVYILYQNRSTGEFRNMSLPANISITLEVALLEDSNKYYIGNATNQTLFELKNGIGEVAVTPTLQSGTKIAEIDVDGTTTNLYAPDISNLATKSEVQAKQDVVQYSELPTPSSTLEGKVLQYIGDGTPSKAVVTVIDDGGNKSSTNTGILSYLQNKNIPLNIGVNTYQIGSSNKYYTLAELQALEEQGSEIIMRGGTDSSFSTDAATVEAFTQDAEAVKTYAETNGFNTKLRIYPQGIRVYGGTDVDEKIGVLNDLGVEMAFNLECNVEMYDMSHSHPGYEEWYEYANGHDAGLGIANVAPFVTMPNGYSKGLMLNRAEMTHAKLKDTQRVADINTMIQAHRYVVLFGHSYQSEWTTAGDDGKTTTELFESFIDDLTETYGDEILWMTPTQAWNYFNSLPKTGHFYKCVAENNTYTWQEIPSVSEVTVTPTLSTGTKIGSISVDGNETDLFAPSGSGGATSLSGLSDVQLSQSIGNGQALRYDSTSGKWINTPFSRFMNYIETAVTEYILAPDTTYFFAVPLEELDITFASTESNSFVDEYHFMFLSGSTPTELSLPSDVIVPDDFSVEANKVYEVSIMNNLMLYNSWTMPEQEEPEQN